MAIRELGLEKQTTGFIDMRYEGHSSVSILSLRDTEDRDLYQARLWTGLLMLVL